MADQVVIIKKVSRKKSGGAKKIGRNIAKCKVYRALGIREKNKARKARKEKVKAAKKARQKARQAERAQQ